MRPFRLSLILGLCLFVVGCTHLDSAPAQSARGTTPLILVSIDGFRADYLDRGITPNLSALAADGVRAQAMRPSFPSLTFPNHYALVTGLRPDHNGIVNNTFEDPAIPGKLFKTADKAVQEDERFWDQGWPIWVSAKQQGLRTAAMFWPGSDHPVHGERPDRWRAYDMETPAAERVDTVLGWMGLPPAERPQFVTLYFDQVDHEGHMTGPDGDTTRGAVIDSDAAVGRLVDGLKRLGLFERTNLIVVADHGMTSTSPDRVIYLDDLVDPAKMHLVAWTAMAALSPAPGAQAEVEHALLGPHEHMTCWRKGELPARFHYGQNPRVPAVICLAQTGWVITTHAMRAGQKRFSLGEHGFDPADPQMAALFLAHGPGFRKGYRQPAFDNVDVYPLMTRLLGLRPAANDGKLAEVQGMLAR